MANIGQSIVFKGELTGDEDLEIDGQVEGDVSLSNHQVTIGSNGKVKAEVTAKSIVVVGRVTGNLIATERVEIQATGVVEGDIKSPRLLVQEGAQLSGRIEMSAQGAGASQTTTSAKPSTAASSASSGSGEAVRKSA